MGVCYDPSDVAQHISYLIPESLTEFLGKVSQPV